MNEKSFKPRRYARYNADLEVTLHLGSGTFRGRITQISRGGCLIFPALPPQPSAHITMSFRLNEELPPITCTGEIIYGIDERGSGVTLADISADNQEMITEFFEKPPQT